MVFMGEGPGAGGAPEAAQQPGEIVPDPSCHPPPWGLLGFMGEGGRGLYAHRRGPPGASPNDRGPPGSHPRAGRESSTESPYFVRTTISAYGLTGGIPPESAVTVAKVPVGTPKRA